MQLPIGYDDFAEILEHNLYFVDKSLFIKAILDDESTKAVVITRPRRFGKTFNLSLLHYFLAERVYGRSTATLFKGLKITQCEGNYMRYQGNYPVVSVSFKDIKESHYDAVYKTLSKLMSHVYLEHVELLQSHKLASHQKKIFESILEEKADKASIKSSLLDLTHNLYQHYNVRPWLLIDEYDTPIQSAYMNGYYGDMIAFMRGLFGSALKNNPYLHKAVITGILRISKESLFSGVNNLEVYSLLRNEYSQYFGFTENEVDNILMESNLSEKADEIKAWYNGYQFGDTTVYNPWSIANCIKRKGHTEPYWINSSDNQLIKDLLKESPVAFKSQFEALMQGQCTEQLIDENMTFVDLKTNSAAIWSLLLMSGYLTPVSCERLWQGTTCQLRVPNQEVNNLYRTIIGMWLANGYGLMWYSHFTQALVLGDMKTFEASLEKVLLHIVSYHDLAKEPEAFFHGLVLGFIASLQETHTIKSNREGGLGRYDILLIPKKVSELGILIELKAKSSSDHRSLETLAAAALKQIDEKHYTAELNSHGIQNALKIAIAFEGKQFALSYAKER